MIFDRDLLTWTALYFGFKYYDSLRDQREQTLRYLSKSGGCLVPAA